MSVTKQFGDSRYESATTRLSGYMYICSKVSSSLEWTYHTQLKPTLSTNQHTFLPSKMADQTPNLAAVVPSAHSDVVVQERPIPSPGPDEILVQNKAIAVNPVDWKRPAWDFGISSYPVILGSGKTPLDFGLLLCARDLPYRFQP